MTTLPSRADIVDPNRTVAEAQGDRGDVRDVVAELRGGSAEEALTLAADIITPTVAAIVIDTEGQLATDDLARIVLDNIPDGRELVIRAADATRRITVKQLAGGSGELELIAGRDIVLNDRHCLFIRRFGLRLVQMFETRPGGAVGEIGWTASVGAPKGSLLAYGQLVNTADYPELFAEIGYTYGGSGPQFGILDLRDRTVIGVGNMGGTPAGHITNTGAGNPGLDTSVLGAAGGVDRHQLTVAQLAAHAHPTRGQTTPQPVTNTGAGTAPATDQPTNTGDAGGDEPHPNVQPGIVLNGFIWT